MSVQGSALVLARGKAVRGVPPAWMEVTYNYIGTALTGSGPSVTSVPTALGTTWHNLPQSHLRQHWLTAALLPPCGTRYGACAVLSSSKLF